MSMNNAELIFINTTSEDYNKPNPFDGQSKKRPKKKSTGEKHFHPPIRNTKNQPLTNSTNEDHSREAQTQSTDEKYIHRVQAISRTDDVSQSWANPINEDHSHRELSLPLSSNSVQPSFSQISNQPIVYAGQSRINSTNEKYHHGVQAKSCTNDTSQLWLDPINDHSHKVQDELCMPTSPIPQNDTQYSLSQVTQVSRQPSNVSSQSRHSVNENHSYWIQFELCPSPISSPSNDAQSSFSQVSNQHINYESQSRHFVNKNYSHEVQDKSCMLSPSLSLHSTDEDNPHEIQIQPSKSPLHMPLYDIQSYFLPSSIALHQLINDTNQPWTVPINESHSQEIQYELCMLSSQNPYYYL
ncbi:14088_t:CDS:2 [Acaulospora colombiana]|uniref:14088_t:CDS:1 n=1 Tax=Acaulospora colombiana TaxID=27376 RepID=A0ACA9K8F0_9GLOM|nr:14088_t:CDS:2 [Acaulospora colombiana]